MELAHNVLTTIFQVLVRIPCILFWSVSFPRYQIFNLTTIYLVGLDLLIHILLLLDVHWWRCWRASSRDAILSVRFQKPDVEARWILPDKGGNLSLQAFVPHSFSISNLPLNLESSFLDGLFVLMFLALTLTQSSTLNWGSLLATFWLQYFAIQV